MTKLFFEPWKRKLFNGTLILCESCPKGDETKSETGWEHSERAYDFIVNHVKQKIRDDDDTFLRLRKSFLYDGKELDKKEFWQRHAFTNLVPRFMNRYADGKIEPPNNGKDKDDAREQFPLIIDYVKPQRILIASAWCVEKLKDLFDDKNYSFPFKSQGDIWEMRYKRIPIVGICHPMYLAYKQDTFIATARKATEFLRNMSQKSN